MVWNSLEQFARAKKNQAGELGQKLSEEDMPDSTMLSKKRCQHWHLLCRVPTSQNSLKGVHPPNGLGGLAKLEGKTFHAHSIVQSPFIKVHSVARKRDWHKAEINRPESSS